VENLWITFVENLKCGKRAKKQGYQQIRCSKTFDEIGLIEIFFTKRGQSLNQAVDEFFGLLITLFDSFISLFIVEND